MAAGLGVTAVLGAAMPGAPAQEAASTTAAQTTAAQTTAAPVLVPAAEPTAVAPATTVVPATATPTTVPAGVISSGTATPATDTATTVPPTGRPTVVAPAPTVGPPSPPAYLTGKTMSVGSRGPAVLALEERLAELRYDVGKIDGKFDWQTWQGVMAFQKVGYQPRTGRATAAFQRDLLRAKKPGGLVPNGGGDRLEVDIARQVLFLFKGGELYRTVSVSSGSGRDYCEISKKTGKQNCGSAVTPRGNFRIQRRISGWRESDLGQLYNPLYFDGGFAIHGAPSVPAGPASHGCVRIPMETAEWFPDAVPNGMPVYLFD